MFSRQRRGVTMAVGAALALLGAPAPSYALFDWLFPGHAAYRGTVTTCYTPPFSGQMGWAPRYSALPWRPIAPAAASCCYVPITVYRTEYCMTPVTTCQPVVYHESCSGCPTVAYRPVTSWAYRPLVVPYGTYRIVASPTTTVCAPVVSRPVCCSPFPAAVSAGGCASCMGTAPPASTISPIPSSTTPVLPAPSLPPSTAPGPLPSGSGQTPTRTFENSHGPSSHQGLKPTPDSNTGPAPARMPALGAPQGRTAQAAIRQAVYVRPASQETQAGSPARPALDTSGWEAAGD